MRKRSRRAPSEAEKKRIQFRLNLMNYFSNTLKISWIRGFRSCSKIKLLQQEPDFLVKEFEDINNKLLYSFVSIFCI